MKRAFEYRVYPRAAERHALEMLLAQGREVYNAALEQCKVVYETAGKHHMANSQWTYFRE